MDSPLIAPFVNSPKIKALDKALTSVTDTLTNEVGKVVDFYDNELTEKQKSYAVAYYTAFPKATPIPFNKLNIDGEKPDTPYQRYVIGEDDYYTYEVDSNGVRYAKARTRVPYYS